MMELTFLQGFFREQILVWTNEDHIANYSYTKAIELAMLGAAEQADAIISLLQAHNMAIRQESERAAMKLFYHAADLSSPFQQTRDAKALQVEGLKLVTCNIGEIYNSEGLDLEEVTEEWYNDLQSWTAGIEAIKDKNPNYSYEAMQVSQALTALLYGADVLGRTEDVEQLMVKMTKRIHYFRQSQCFPMALIAWEKYFLPGGLRRALNLQEQDVKDYADYVLETLQRRLQDGPVQPIDPYKGKSMRELLEKLNRSTMDDTSVSAEERNNEQASIFMEPATDEQISQTEEKLGRSLPEDVKEFYKITNGCHPVKVDPGFRDVRFVPLEQVYLEEDEGLAEYSFSLLPGLQVSEESDHDLEIEWLKTSGGVIAMYENDGEGTMYTWVLPKVTVDAARARIQKVYEAVDDEQKKMIDSAIQRRYGGRKAYDDMKYCIVVQEWGEPGQRVHRNFWYYLRSVVHAGRPTEERSPLKSSA